MEASNISAKASITSMKAFMDSLVEVTSKEAFVEGFVDTVVNVTSVESFSS